MIRLSKKYQNVLQLLMILLPIIWVFDLWTKNTIMNVVNVTMVLLIAFTIFLSIYLNRLRKMYYRYTLIMIFTIIGVIIYCTYLGVDLTEMIRLITMVVLPISLLIIDEVRISDRLFGILIILTGLFCFLNVGNLTFMKELSCVLVPLSFIVIYKEDNLYLKMLYIISNIFLISLITDKIYVIIFTFLLQFAVAVAEDKRISKGFEIGYFIVFVLIVFFVACNFIVPSIPISVLMAILVNKGFIKDKKHLLFTANDLSIGGIETALINLVNGIDSSRYDVVIIVEKKGGVLENKLDKDVYIKRYKVYDCKVKVFSKCLNFIKRFIFSILNYDVYDFSCCYATYSYCGNKLTRIASRNSSIWVHSNYKYVYNDIKKTKEFFETRSMDKFRRIIFVSNESKQDYLEIYPDHEERTLVINNFVDEKAIIKKSKVSIGISKPKNKKLLVFVGRLEEESKKITRIIEIAKEIPSVAVWIIGDGKDKLKYQKLIEENNLGTKVTLFGSITEPYNYMDKADYIILTSDYEGFPVVYLEALVLNKEIITTIPVSDDNIDFNERAHIISKDNYVKDVKRILRKKEKKNSEINIKEIQFQRKKKLEKLFEEVI